MSFSYEGIGAWCASFACTDVTEGSPVKPSANGTVAECASGDVFCGIAAAVAHDGSACAVQLAGLVTVKYSGTAPTLGTAKLAADGNGGVSVTSGGASYAVFAVDSAAKTVTIKL